MPVNYDLNRYSEEVQFTFTFQNHGNKEIRAFTGIASFSDIFGRPIKSIEITYDEPLKNGQLVTWKGVWDPNQFIDEDQQLVNTTLTNLIFLFKTEAVIFVDGSRLETSGATTATTPSSASPTTSDETALPFLFLEPDFGPPGTVVQVVGGDFGTGNEPLSILKIGDVDVRPIPVPRTTTGGTFFAPFIVPNLPLGENIVQVSVGMLTAHIVFTVTAGAGP